MCALIYGPLMIWSQLDNCISFDDSDFQQCDLLTSVNSHSNVAFWTSVDSDEPVQPFLKLRNSK